MQNLVATLRCRLAALKALRKRLARQPLKRMPVFWHVLVMTYATLSLQFLGPKIMHITEEFDAAMRTHAWDASAWAFLALLIAIGLWLAVAAILGTASIRALTDRVNEHRMYKQSPKRTRPLRPRSRRH